MAVFVGFISVAVLSLGTDQVLHVLEIYPPWGKPMHDPSLNVLALSYRIVYTILGGYITASLAPHAPMRHVIVVGIVGFVAGSAGAITAITVADLGPDWYPSHSRSRRSPAYGLAACSTASGTRAQVPVSATGRRGEAAQSLPHD